MLILLRSILLRIHLVLITAVIGIFALFTLFRRDWALETGKFWSRSVLFGARLFCGVRHDVLHPERIPQGGALIAAKHQSFWETMALTTILPNPCFVLKKELLLIPVFGWWLRACGFIWIDRKAGTASMRKIMTAAERELAAGRQIVIFPEGTRTPPGKTSPYQPGVAGLYASLGVPCIPVAHNSGLYWRQPGLVRVPGEISISFEEPIPAGLKRKAFMRDLQGVIESRSLQLAGITSAATGQATTEQANTGPAATGQATGKADATGDIVRP